MPLLNTIAGALALSNNYLESGVVQEIIERDETFALIPFMRVMGKAYVYNRENVLATVDWLNPNDTVLEGASTFTQVTATMKILIGDVDVDKFLEGTMSDTNDQKATQIALKAKGMARQFKTALVQGDTSVLATQFDGFRRLVTLAANAAMTIVQNGPLTLTGLDALADAVILGADAYIMRPGTIRAYRALLRLQAGTDGNMIELPNFGVPVLAHNGLPILRNDYIPSDETVSAAPNTGCSVYAVRFNEGDGVHGLYGGERAGIVVEDVGTVQNKDATRTRLKWYCGLAMKSTRSLARMSGVTNL